jgi:hypothetical protein
MWLASGPSSTDHVYSYDGINWTAIDPILQGMTISLTWNGTIWLAGGNANNPGVLVDKFYRYSYDGINWSPSQSATNMFRAPISSIRSRRIEVYPKAIPGVISMAAGTITLVPSLNDTIFIITSGNAILLDTTVVKSINPTNANVTSHTSHTIKLTLKNKTTNNIEIRRTAINGYAIVGTWNATDNICYVYWDGYAVTFY